MFDLRILRNECDTGARRSLQYPKESDVERHVGTGSRLALLLTLRVGGSRNERRIKARARGGEG